MPCWFTVIGQVIAIKQYPGKNCAQIAYNDGQGHIGELQEFELFFFNGGDTTLIANRAYLLKGSLVLSDPSLSGRPKVRNLSLLSTLLYPTL
jgi:hypothetical protein